MNRGAGMLVSIRGRSHASAPSLRAALLSGATAFPPAFFLALLEAQEQLPSPGRGEFVIGDGRDTDAGSPQPEMREDALATFAAFGDAFHDPAPCLWRGSRRPRGAGFCTCGQGWRTARQARPQSNVGVAHLDGVCDNATRGQAVRACSRNESSSAEQERAVCGAAEKRKRSVD